MNKPHDPLTETERRQLRDELHWARQMGRHMDRVIDALMSTTTYEIDATCVRCGKREIFHTRDPKAPAELSVICTRCSTGDAPRDAA